MGRGVKSSFGMKILLASSSSGSRGGGELYLLYLARALTGRGHEVTLWASSHSRMDELSALFAPIGLVVRSDYTNTYDHRTRSSASFLNRVGARRIAGEWMALRPDFIHINKQNLEDGLDLLHAAALTGLPTLATIHLTQSARYLGAVCAGVRDWISRRALNAYVGPLVCVLEQRARDLRDFIGDQPRIHAIPNGVELYDLSQRAAARAAKRAELGIAPGTLLVAAVGRLMPQKRPLVFLELAEMIHARLPDAQFAWIGDGDLGAEWDARVAGRGLGGFVRRIGWQRSVREFLFASDVFLHTAEFEGLPLAILEALSAGLPCAITPNLLSEMPFLNTANSISIEGDGAWAAILGDRSKLSMLGQNARQLAEAQFSYEKMAARFETLYRAQMK
jgi:glycosyltransferase involved in cell wall biosynthesis